MKVFVSFDGDHIGRMVGRASLADKPEEVSKIAQAIDRGNQIWRSWAESHGGQVINIGGDEGRLVVEADHLGELPKIRDQYAEAVGSTVSVGVGMKLSEADKSLMAAKLQGGNRIQLFTEEVNEVLEELQEKPEGEKLYDEYLDPNAGAPIAKANPAMNAGEHAGFSGASRSQAAAPTAPREGSEHSEAEAARQVYADASGVAPAPDYEQLFHQAAAQTLEDAPQKPSGLQDDVRSQVVKILQQVRGQAPKLEEMRQSNPDLYASVKGLVEAMIALARGQDGDLQKSEGLLRSPAFRHLGSGQVLETPGFHNLDDLEGQVGSAVNPDEWEQGFVDRHGQFFNRQQAAELVAPGREINPLVQAPGGGLESQEYELGHEKGIYKAEPRVGFCKWKLGERRCRRLCTGSYCHTHKKHVKALRKDLMPGGQGDDLPDTDFDADQLADGARREMEEHGLDEERAIEVAKDHLTEDPDYYRKMDKAALEAGKTGRHQVVLPVGAQVDPGPDSNHEGGEIKVRDPETGKSKWRQVRSGLVMAPDGTPTSSRNPGG